MKIKIIKSTYRNASTKPKAVVNPIATVSKEKSKVRVCKISRLINSEALVVAQFNRAMEFDNKKRAELNAPIAKYDVARRKAYMEYPDGRIVYVT